MRTNLLASMNSERLDVVIKRQNTAAFFKEIKDARNLAEYLRKIREKRDEKAVAV